MNDRRNENAPVGSDQGAKLDSFEGAARTIAHRDRPRKLPGRRLARRDGRDLLVQVHPRTGAVRLALAIADASKPAGERVVHFVFVDVGELAIVRAEIDRAIQRLNQRGREREHNARPRTERGRP